MSTWYNNYQYFHKYNIIPVATCVEAPGESLSESDWAGHDIDILGSKDACPATVTL